ncbi:MAG: hypothetical protein FJ312_09815 [SAR202 cluster bacterium]|nr:hypothetical protein [SAR202 cluster bacterium]
MTQQSEKVFLDERGVTVTQSRFVVDGQTFAMSAITAVSSRLDWPPRKWQFTMMAVGVVLFVIGLKIPLPGATKIVGILLGIVLVVAGLVWLLTLKKRHYVMLRTGDADVRAVGADDEQWVKRIVAALNEAIAARG